MPPCQFMHLYTRNYPGYFCRMITYLNFFPHPFIQIHIDYSIKKKNIYNIITTIIIFK